MSGVFEQLEISRGAVSARIVPARGALVSALKVNGRDVLYMDRATLDDPARSVRGGIPILFPFAGRLDGDRLLSAGTVMKQHGFARNRAWTVAAHDGREIRLTLADDEQTRAVYPHRFALEQALTLQADGLRVELRVHNRGDAPMPLSPGWHPYFCCASADKPRVRPLDVPELDPARFTPDREFDFGVTAPADGRASFDIPGLGRLRLEFSPELRFLQCWGLPGRDFICLEPFLGPNNTVNTPARFDLAPGARHSFWMRIALG